VKKTTLILLASILVLSGCSVFDLQSRAKHSHLNKVPVNGTASVSTHNNAYQAMNSNDTAVIEIISESDPVIASDEPDMKPAANTVSKRKVNPVKSIDVLRDFNKTFRTQAKAQSANDHQSIDPVTVLIWVLVIAVILALLGYFVQALWTVLIFILIIALVFFLITFVASNI